MDIKETNTIGDEVATHWYYTSKAKAMMSMLRGIKPLTILDVGAGSGYFSHYLLNATSALNAYCVDTGYKENYDSQEGGKSIFYRATIEKSEADLVLLMDVLEHVEDDVELLKHYVDLSPIGTKFLITVPAFQFLWSGHDVFLEHKRRYQLHKVEEVAMMSGLTVMKANYYFGIVFPITAILRLRAKLNTKKNYLPASQLKKHHPLINAILSALCHYEILLMPLNRLLGLTCFCLAVKK